MGLVAGRGRGLGGAAAEAAPAGRAPARLPGVVVAIVTDNDDPERLGRVKLQLPVAVGRLREPLGAGGGAGQRRVARAWSGSPRSTTRCSSRSRAATASAPSCSAASGTAATRRRRSRWTTGSSAGASFVSRDGNQVYMWDKPGNSSLGMKTRGRRGGLPPEPADKELSGTSEGKIVLTADERHRDQGDRQGEDQRRRGGRDHVERPGEAHRLGRRRGRHERHRQGQRQPGPAGLGEEDDPMVNDEFIGAGWAFPLRTDATGGIALVTPRARDRGEHPPHPRHGLRRAADAPGVRLRDPRRGLRAAPTRRPSAGSPPTCAPRCAAGSPGSPSRTSRCRPDEDDPSTLYIDIRYTIGSSNDPRNLVFPFYVIPAED